MKNIIKKQYGLFLSLLVAASAFSGLIFSSPKVEKVSAAVDINDYSACDQKHNSGNASGLFEELQKITAPGKAGSYNALWGTYSQCYTRDSQGHIFDYYSNITNYTSSSSHSGNQKEGDGYNREHSIPKSWWGGATTNQGADPYIVVPTDCKINGMRSNYPFGMVASIDDKSSGGYSKRGSPVTSWGYNGGLVFEPNDSVKGDFARIYFYAITKYDTSGWRSGEGSSCFTSDSSNFGLTNYAVKLFSYWSNLDPVSEWEMGVNDRVSAIQGNRNPFIDHPEYANTLWGNVTDYTEYTHSSGGVTPSASISISKTSISFKEGETTTISATSSNSSQISWSTNDSKVATISSSTSSSGSNVTITAVGEGSTTIYAQAHINNEYYSKSCTVTVSKNSGGGESVEPGEEVTVNVDFTNNNYYANDEKGVEWEVKGTYEVGNYIRVYGTTTYIENNSLIDVDTTKKVTVKARLRTYDGVHNQSLKITAYDSLGNAISNTLTLAPENKTMTEYSGELIFTNQTADQVNFRAYCGNEYKLGIASLTFTYASAGSGSQEEIKTLNSISVRNAPANVQYKVGDYFDPTGLSLTLVYSDKSIDVLSYSGNEDKFIFNPSLTTALILEDEEIVITYGGKTTSVSISVTNPEEQAEELSGDYSLTSNSPFINGVAYKLFITYGNKNYYFAGDKTNTYYGKTDTSISNAADVFFENSGNGQNIYFELNSVRQYFVIKLSGTHINFDYQITEPSTKWIYSGEKCVMYYTIGDKQYSFGNNEGYTTFNGYDLSNDNGYYVEQFVSTGSEGSIAFGEVLLTSMTCDSQGKTSPTFATGKDWTILNKVYNNLNDSNKLLLRESIAKEKGTIIQQAMARYDYIVSKYDGVFTNFIGRSINSIQSNVETYSQKSNVSVIVAVIGASVAITFVGVVLLTKKKKYDCK